MEVLVVIAVIGVLIGILVPAAGKARDAARQTRELAAAPQLMVAYHVYADDNRGSVLPGYVPANWVTPSPAGPSLTVLDETGEHIYGQPARRYPWRLAPYLEYNFAGLYSDRHVLDRYKGRSDYQYVVSISPSYGLNSVFVGGDAAHRGFDPLSPFGCFYVTRLDQASRPAALITFASARGQDPDGGSSVPGFFRVLAPFETARVWRPVFSPDGDAEDHGNVDFRFGRKAATAMLDGHAATEGFETLEDMRRWNDRAPHPDSVLSPK